MTETPVSDWIAVAFLLPGAFFCLVAAIGVVRLNDVYARMHAATKAGTLGLALICVAAMVKAENWQHVIEASFVFLFMIASAPVGAHLIGRAVFRRRGPIDPRTRADPDIEDFRVPESELTVSSIPPADMLPQSPDEGPDQQDDRHGQDRHRP
jgi:multicomponent Na+:H+ antiporter subunit G